MDSKNTYQIELPQYCNYLYFEDILKKHYKMSFIKQAVCFNFNHTEWIGPLQLNLLFGWIKELVDKSVFVIINIDSTIIEKQAINFICNIGFIKELQNIGVKITSTYTENKARGLSSFKLFKNIDELYSYEKSLETLESCKSLLGVGEEIDLIRDGDYRDIIVHELGLNAFIHGLGRNVRYSASEFPISTHRSEHKFLSTFKGSAYIEVTVSDSGKGLFSTLSKYMPDSYEPNVEVKNRSISRFSKVIAYAFEYNSTCNEKSRIERLRNVYQNDLFPYDSVPSGLFYIYSLTKVYGGQILIRTIDSIVSLDFSEGYYCSIYTQSKLTRIPGTHIVIRVPRSRGLAVPIHFDTSSDINIKSIKYKTLVFSEVVKEYEKVEILLKNIENKLVETFCNSSKKSPILLIILMNGSHIDTKLFSMLLMILSTIPRRNSGLILFGLSKEYIETSQSQWDYIKQLRLKHSHVVERIHGLKSFILTSSDLSSIIHFGDTHHNDSTKMVSDGKVTYLRHNISSLNNLYLKSLRDEIGNYINTNILHHAKDTYYLIENKYYTEYFYEISKMLSDANWRLYSQEYLKLLLIAKNVESVYVISEPLYPLIDELAQHVHNIKIFKRTEDTPITSLMKAHLDLSKDAKIAILTDVICTAGDISYILSFCSNIDKILLICFVDARDESVDYYTEKRPEQAYTIPVECILKQKVLPIYDLPKKKEFKIFIIDKKTHSPTTYDNINLPTFLTPEKLLLKANDIGALLQGHYDINSKHYSLYLNLPILFKHMYKELCQWWDNTIKIYHGNLIELNQILVLYLNEKKGWENIIVDYFSTKGVIECKSISREYLEAQPEISDKFKCIWFILPAIASGDTAMKCLELASRYKPDNIHLSILIARINSTLLSFYQNITGYRDSKKVMIDMFSWLPIIVYSSDSSCPSCNTIRVIDNILQRVYEYDILSSILQDVKSIFDIHIIEQDLEVKANIDETNVRLAALRAHYEESRRNIHHRRLVLAPLLEKTEERYLFLEMVGKEYLAPAFSQTEVKRVTYRRYEQIEDFASFCLKNPTKKEITLSLLLGIYRLFPDLLLSNMSFLIKQSILKENHQLYKYLVFMALLDGEKYASSILMTSVQCPEDIWFKRLIKEIREYPHWYITPESYAIADFYKLLWLLRRSTKWGMNIEYLRSVLRNTTSTKEEIHNAFTLLHTEGIYNVIRCISSLSERERLGHGKLWESLLIIDPDIEHTTQRLVDIDDVISKTILENNDNYRTIIIQELNKLDDEAKTILNIFYKLFTNPIDVIIKLEDIFKTRYPLNILTINFNVARNQPGILFYLDDLIQSICVIIDNAVTFIGGLDNDENKVKKYYLEIKFDGYTKDKYGSTMLIIDNIPWIDKIVPSGGLKQFAEYCRKYGAVYDYDPKSHGEPENVKIKVVLKIDKERN